MTLLQIRSDQSREYLVAGNEFCLQGAIGGHKATALQTDHHRHHVDDSSRHALLSSTLRHRHGDSLNCITSRRRQRGGGAAPPKQRANQIKPGLPVSYTGVKAGSSGKATA